ncbi:MAG: hypothetical protein ACYTBV_10390, partial [Planctomycetota bacterium]
MSGKKNKIITDSVIAISCKENRLRAVSMKKRGSGVKVLWTKSSDYGDLDWRQFASRCGLSARANGQTKGRSSRSVVAGFDSSGVVFYRVTLPAVKDKELATMIRLQGEARLPLPAEKMNMTWRVDQSQNGRIPVTIAAAKNDQLRNFIGDVDSVKPDRIMLDCEAVVKAWKEIYSGTDSFAVVISVGARESMICEVDGGRLNNSVILDLGVEDFIEAEQSEDHEKIDAMERFAQDMRSVLDMFGHSDHEKVPIYVLSSGGDTSEFPETYDNSEVIGDIVTYLGAEGLDIRRVSPDKGRFTKDTQLGDEEIYDYRVAIGLGMMALDGRAEVFNVFEQLYRPARERQEKKELISLKASVVLAVVMVILLAGIFYAADVLALKRIEKHFKGEGEQASISQIMSKRDLMRAAARRRPDLLSLFQVISSVEGGGIKLESFKYAKGRKIEISGQADKDEQVFKFQEGLLAKKKEGITDVDIKSMPK